MLRFSTHPKPSVTIWKRYRRRSRGEVGEERNDPQSNLSLSCPQRLSAPHIKYTCAKNRVIFSSSSLVRSLSSLSCARDSLLPPLIFSPTLFVGQAEIDDACNKLRLSHLPTTAGELVVYPLYSRCRTSSWAFCIIQFVFLIPHKT
jgi:hypothetical protein